MVIKYMPLMLIVPFALALLSCKGSIEPSLDEEISKASSIIRVRLVSDGGQLRAKKEEVIMTTRKINYSRKYVPFPDLPTLKSGDEWIVFYRLRDTGNGASEYVDAAISVTGGQLNSDPKISIEELRKKAKSR